MRAASQQHFDVVLFFRPHAAHAFAAPVLSLVAISRDALDVAGRRNRHHANLPGDQVFHQQLAFLRHNHGAARVSVLGLDLQEFILDNVHNHVTVRQQLAQISDATEQFLMLGAQLVNGQVRQLVQAHLQDRTRLRSIKSEPLNQNPAGLVARFGDCRMMRTIHRCSPCAIISPADVSVALFGFVQLKLRPPNDTSSRWSMYASRTCFRFKVRGRPRSTTRN